MNEYLKRCMDALLAIPIPPGLDVTSREVCISLGQWWDKENHRRFGNIDTTGTVPPPPTPVIKMEWRDAKPEDLGKGLRCRLRDYDIHTWSEYVATTSTPMKTKNPWFKKLRRAYRQGQIDAKLPTACYFSGEFPEIRWYLRGIKKVRPEQPESLGSNTATTENSAAT